jgi:ABC-type lipoprotein release transport system permease subunit
MLNLRVGLFLGRKHIQRSSLWTNLLVVSVMFLTFLNLVVISGILVGLIAGASNQYEQHYSGNIVISNLMEKENIQESDKVINILDSFSEIENYSPRYIHGVSLEANYQTRTKLSDISDETGASLRGINPFLENSVTDLSKFVVEGEYLNPNDEGKILLGSDLLSQYARDSFFESLEDVQVGDKVRANINGIIREYTVKGIVQSKLGEVGLSAFVLDTEMRKLLGRTSYEFNEIAINLKPGVDPDLFKQKLIKSGLDQFAVVKTSVESQGDFYQEIQLTFNLLGTIVSGIGLGVGFL